VSSYKKMLHVVPAISVPNTRRLSTGMTAWLKSWGSMHMLQVWEACHIHQLHSGDIAEAAKTQSKICLQLGLHPRLRRGAYGAPPCLRLSWAGAKPCPQTSPEFAQSTQNQKLESMLHCSNSIGDISTDMWHVTADR